MVTLSFLSCLCCFLLGLFWSPMQYMHHPTRNMKSIAGRSIIILELLRLGLRFEATNLNPTYLSTDCKISFDNSEYRFKITKCLLSTRKLSLFINFLFKN